MVQRIGAAFLVCSLFLVMATLGGVQTSVVDHTEGAFSSSLPTRGNTRYDMVVIAPDGFSEVLQPFIEHKNSYNMSTFLKPVEDIYAEYEGRDNAEQIKYFIKNAVETWHIEYVLLFGSSDMLPMRKSMMQCSFYDFEYVPTDMYYADIYDENGSFCSWDSNHNNLFGEFSWEMSNNDVEYVDNVNLYPDVGIGRLPCSNDGEVDAMVDKIIAYETQTYGQDWFTRILLMGGDTHSQHEGNEGEIVTEYVAEAMTGFEPVKLWTSLGTFKPHTINKEISAGAGFISYSGHGKAWEISTNRPSTERRIHYFSPYLLGLSNADKLPVVFLDACKTATPDFGVLGIDLPSFAWMMVKQPDSGAIATIGASRMGYGGVVGNPLGGGTCRMNANFFEAYEPGITVSQMLTAAQTAYLDDLWKDCLTLQEFMLIGDPSLRVGGYP